MHPKRTNVDALHVVSIEHQNDISAYGQQPTQQR